MKKPLHSVCAAAFLLDNLKWLPLCFSHIQRKEYFEFRVWSDRVCGALQTHFHEKEICSGFCFTENCRNDHLDWVLRFSRVRTGPAGMKRSDWAMRVWYSRS